ncbi:lipid A 4'-phosphatase LpxF [Francisella tularensis]|uniref:lipid A 4'-phosphatase LpxF n=1 Tax=Francisella tularensis TaxID=263 RepID=UPI000173E281|nr:lipid A 4'-phosphatase LpxF [Francisella tularensis]ACD30321.1 phosphatidic acid phosphatase, PAP2 superfamily [Francisella tularensis subsp. mediasiatica FSC147]MBK2077613.1 phosphatase PAP2 family protein [Francisella tularensis subsp. mediasiatica]MBK2101347.1 phosphatase PAP2 family protein [Francisella tularensis subsp. mediasiatica]MBK2104889.1 phosphatase PAP2 family protein [Francisella tularensis subsp. mediasiatica]MDN9002637.1 phosphatase PAP2 family protein [Francisella tularens
MARFHIILGLVVCFFAWIFFLIFPNLDIQFAGHFYNSSAHQFIDGYDGFLGFLHWFARFFPIFFSIIVILFLLGSLFIDKFKIKYRKAIFFIAVCLWIGPGLVVNYVFKDHWGRPRPVMVKQFNGDKIFQPPFVISSQCDKNCSFVCGDASMGFWLFAFMSLLATRKKKLVAFIVAVVAGGGLGLMRMSQGGHFFSDVVFCGIFVYISTWVVYALMYRKKEY